MKKNFKNCSGGILLEVLFMLAILMLIFPIMQKDVKKRTDEIRNTAVVKDLMKLKGAVENYLKRKPTFENAVTDIDFKDLVESGLPVTFSKTNLLGQEYKVRVKTSTDIDGNVVYDAVIIATGNNDIPSVRIRDIVKNAKGYAGYVEDGLIYGPNWQLSASAWDQGGDINDSSIVMKTGFSRKDYKYVSRVPGIGSSTMETNLYMNLNSIYNVNNLFINEKAELGTFEAQGNSTISDMAIDKSLSLEADMNVGSSFNFPNGLSMSSLTYEDDVAAFVFLENLLSFNGNLLFSSEDRNILRYIYADTLKVSDSASFPTLMKVANLFSLYFDPTISSTLTAVLNVNNAQLNSFDNEKNNTSSYGLVFNDQIVSRSNPIYRLNSSSAGMYDIIIKDVNSKLLSRTSKIGGIDIDERTPISVILRALTYEYADIYKIVYNDYPDAVIPGWYYNLYKRCEYNECVDTGWYY